MTTSEMPSHTHSIGSHTHSMTHSHSDTFSTSSSGSHRHSLSDCQTGAEGPTGSVKVMGFGTGTSTTGNGLTLSDHQNTLAYPSSGGSWGYVTLNINGWHVHDLRGYTASDGSHSHTISGSVSQYSGSTGSASGTTGSAGSGNAHSHGNTGSALSDQNILGPYITCYIWRRTA